MKPPPFRYLRANTINEAVNALQSENEARILAGGQSLIAMMNLRVVYSKCLIDINSIEELDYIVERDDGIAVGALSRLCAIKDSAIVAEFCPLLAEAQDFIANKTVRNRATIGGNVCHADPAFEIPAVLIVARAVMVISGVGGQRVVDAENFFQGMYTTAVEENELLVEIRVPKIRQKCRHGDHGGQLTQGRFRNCGGGRTPGDRRRDLQRRAPSLYGCRSPCGTDRCCRSGAQRTNNRRRDDQSCRPRRIRIRGAQLRFSR